MPDHKQDDAVRQAWANHAPIEREVESPHRPASLAGSGTTGYEIRQRHSKTSAPETADGIHR